ncbi:hypothetical protein LT85_1328 [Collimonas arenae]|uniref:Lipoprotein n=1 Tax=Collimonas arenae TaxID=279058 RepID=A0A0A1F7H9_9BURK|nr:hypothetical protein [Collimonas arenae]AIY40486.1 hypothetical protein LT85_1328 [Collimonas arenae]
MKTLLICSLILPLVAACATGPDQDSAADARQETVYRTGSLIPTKKNPNLAVDTLNNEQARDMIGPPNVPKAPGQ